MPLSRRAATVQKKAEESEEEADIPLSERLSKRMAKEEEDEEDVPLSKRASKKAKQEDDESEDEDVPLSKRASNKAWGHFCVYVCGEFMPIVLNVLLEHTNALTHICIYF